MTIQDILNNVWARKDEGTVDFIHEPSQQTEGAK